MTDVSPYPNLLIFLSPHIAVSPHSQGCRRRRLDPHPASALPQTIKRSIDGRIDGGMAVTPIFLLIQVPCNESQCRLIEKDLAIFVDGKGEYLFKGIQSTRKKSEVISGGIVQIMIIRTAFCIDNYLSSMQGVSHKKEMNHKRWVPSKFMLYGPFLSTWILFLENSAGDRIPRARKLWLYTISVQSIHIHHLGTELWRAIIATLNLSLPCPLINF